MYLNTVQHTEAHLPQDSAKISFRSSEYLHYDSGNTYKSIWLIKTYAWKQFDWDQKNSYMYLVHYSTLGFQPIAASLN